MVCGVDEMSAVVGDDREKRKQTGAALSQSSSSIVERTSDEQPSVPLDNQQPNMANLQSGTKIASQTTNASLPSESSQKATLTSPVVARPPSVPEKHTIPSHEVSRRNFLKGLVVIGGIITVAQFVPLADSYMRGSTEGAGYPIQVIQDIQTGQPIKTTDVAENNWTTFVYPRTGNPNIDNDTFRQFVIIHLPKGFSAPSNLSAKDPISADTFVALSRVCVHLWCLWSYVPVDRRCECPCHGSQYVPGTGPPYYDPPGLAVAGPASLQTPPNNQLPMATISISSNGTISATGLVGEVGCGQKC